MRGNRRPWCLWWRPSRGSFFGSRGSIEAYDEGVVALEGIRRDAQVHRRRRTLEHAPREVELRTVAGAEESTRPVRRDGGVTRRETRLGQTTEMRAGADEHEHLGLQRAVLVLRVRGLF